MAEEAFALSPISARPNVPGEADYEAIREAFMETARGRWFLNEYAKRNRHTDTGMVLEAVARIEASLKAQKQAPAAVGLAEALGAIRAAVRHAKATAIESLPRLDDDTLTAARNGARIVREIAWTLRECGADTRICDLLDTQVKAIDAGLQGAGHDGREAVMASYDLLMQRIEQLVDGSGATSETSAAKAETRTAAESPVASAEVHASITPLFKTPEPVVEPAVTPEPVVEEAIAPTVDIVPAAAEAVAPIAESIAEIAATIAEASLAEVTEEEPPVEPRPPALDAEAQDLAVLDRVAIEMAAQDFSEPETTELEMDEPEIARQTTSPEVAKTRAASAPVPDIAAPAPMAEVASVALAPEPAPVGHPSLGAALIANGVISNPNAPASDPLAPIRRMSQAEKIAFFS